MKRFLTKAALLVLPFALYFAVVVVVDPFCHFGLVRLSFERKVRVASRLHYPMWRAHQFAAQPDPRIVLGDSRMDHLPLEEVERLTGRAPFNFTFGGGTLAECIDAFWFSAQRTKLEEVTFGLSFFNFNARENMNRFVEAKRAVDDPRFYLVDRSVARGTVNFLRDIVHRGPDNAEAPPMNREEFWQYQLDVGATRLYSKYVYPDGYEEQLREIADYCRDHDVKLVFVIPPSHVELQRKVDAFGLADQQRRFRAFLKGLAPVIDFDYPTRLTEDAAAFNDPFHPSPSARLEFVREIWGNDRLGIATHSTPGDAVSP